MTTKLAERYDVRLAFDNDREVMLINVTSWRVDDLVERMNIGKTFSIDAEDGWTYYVNPDKIAFMTYKQHSNFNF